MSNICFVCNEPNYNRNETLATVRRIERDEVNGATTTTVWSGMICDACLKKIFEKKEDIVDVLENDAEVYLDIIKGLFDDLKEANPEMADNWLRAWPDIFGQKEDENE